MKNIDIQNPITYYSPYGYIQVDKNEYFYPDTNMVTFHKPMQKMIGTLKVK